MALFVINGPPKHIPLASWSDSIPFFNFQSHFPITFSNFIFKFYFPFPFSNSIFQIHFLTPFFISIFRFPFLIPFSNSNLETFKNWIDLLLIYNNQLLEKLNSNTLGCYSVQLEFCLAGVESSRTNFCYRNCLFMLC